MVVLVLLHGLLSCWIAQPHSHPKHPTVHTHQSAEGALVLMNPFDVGDAQGRALETPVLKLLRDRRSAHSCAVRKLIRLPTAVCSRALKYALRRGTAAAGRRAARLWAARIARGWAGQTGFARAVPGPPPARPSLKCGDLHSYICVLRKNPPLG